MSEKTNSFRNSIDNMEPADGAKERMLLNIRRKAAEQAGTAALQKVKRPKTLSLHSVMKWAVPVAACLAITVAGIKVIPKLISSPGENEGKLQNVNPFSEVQSADEFTKRLEINIDAPEGSEDVIYNILDGSIANIEFRYNGNSYTLRASKQSGDFSGIHGTLIKIDKIDAATDAVLETIRFDKTNHYKLTWTDGSVTYILANDSAISAEDIIGIYELVK